MARQRRQWEGSETGETDQAAVIQALEAEREALVTDVRGRGRAYLGVFGERRLIGDVAQRPRTAEEHRRAGQLALDERAEEGRSPDSTRQGVTAWRDD